jgi:hypothetical protein
MHTSSSFKACKWYVDAKYVAALTALTAVTALEVYQRQRSSVHHYWSYVIVGWRLHNDAKADI